jgi:hypothetical protein
MGTPNLAQKNKQDTLDAFQQAQPLEGDFLVEVIVPNNRDAEIQRVLITNQADATVGAIAYSVQGLDREGRMLSLEHYYPLQSNGMDAIMRELVRRCEQIGAERQVTHPGCLVYSAAKRGLEAVVK